VVVTVDPSLPSDRSSLGARAPQRAWVVATHGRNEARVLFEGERSRFGHSTVFDRNGNFLGLMSDAGPVEFRPTGDRRLVTVD